MTRVLFTQRGSGGGSATGLLDLLRALNGSGVQSVVMLYGESSFRGEFEEAGAETFLLADGPQGDPASEGRISRGIDRISGNLGRLGALLRLTSAELPMARSMARHIERVGPEIVHHNIHPTTDRPAIIGTFLSGVPQVSHVRWIKKPVPYVDSVVARSVDHFVYMSEAIRRDVEPRLHIPRDRGSVIYDPFDLERWGADHDPGPTIRAELGIPEAAVVLSNVGRLVPWKGQEVFLRAFGLLDLEDLPVHAILVGDAGSPDDRDYLARLHSVAVELGIEGRVHFVGFRRDIPELLGASDVVVHSSTTPEPFGRVVVEGMAAGRPVVATAAGGPLEIVDQGETGMLVEPGDAEAMASALRWLIRNPSRAREMGERGREVAEDRYGAPRFAEELTRIYRRVLDG